MFEFLIAFFGGIYLIPKLISEKVERDQSEREFAFQRDFREKRSNAWKAQVIDTALQEDLYDYVVDPKNREAVWDVVREASAKMRFQKSYDSINEWEYDGVLDRTKAGRNLYHVHRFLEPLDILLAKNGKVRSIKAMSPVAYLSTGEGQRTKLKWDRTVEFWVYIRDELRKSGVDACLLFKEESNEGMYKGNYFYVDDVEKFRYKCGELSWLPSTWVNSDLNPI